MKTNCVIPCLNVGLALALAILLSPAGFAQGALTPPAGPPAPTMKTLDQVEARIIVNATNTPGDATNTLIISAPGSYYLTGNITGAVGKHGISVQASDVTLDLNGFALISGGGEATRGVNTTTPITGFCIRNGGVRGWTGGGIRADTAVTRAEKLNLSDNTGATGMVVGNGSLVTDCVARGNTTGFYCPDRTQISNCIATLNTGDGFLCTSFVSLFDCTSSRNSGYGFVVGGSCSVIRCNASRNDIVGIFADAGSNVIDCTAGSNVRDGIQLGDGGTVRSCTARANGGAGIGVTNGSHVSENTCESNYVGISVSAPGDAGGQRNRIDSNTCTRNQVGISIIGLFNLIIRNHAGGNTADNFAISSLLLNQVGPMVTGSGTITSTSPWANFAN